MASPAEGRVDDGAGRHLGEEGHGFWTEYRKVIDLAHSSSHALPHESESHAWRAQRRRHIGSGRMLRRTERGLPQGGSGLETNIELV